MVVKARFDVKRIAIIGAGPCGLSAAKYLLAQKTFDKIVIFEQQGEVGGVWKYHWRPTDTLHVPQVSPFCPPDPPLEPLNPDERWPPVFPSPMYTLLHTNIPGPLMQFSDLDFPTEGLIFPHRETVHEYLVGYSQDVRHLIKFSTVVKHIRLREEVDKDQWDVTSEPASGEGCDQETFDAVVVATGHYATTFMPDIPNIREFHEAHPGVIMHAKHYRRPSDVGGGKIVVVGNAASGVDIAAQLSHSGAEVLLSVHTPTPPENLAHIGAEEVPAIAEFLVDEMAVRLVDGRVVKGISRVIFCTGYLFSLPFFEKFGPSLITDGRRVHGLYKDFLHIKHPTLAFPGLPIKVVPFPVSEGQAAVLGRLWANATSLPSQREMTRWEEEAEKERGSSFHVYPKNGDVEYLKEMHAWAMQSPKGGKEPPVWTEEQVWQRQIYAEAKLEFEKTGRVAKTLGELGFHFRSKCGSQEDAEEIL